MRRRNALTKANLYYPGNATARRKQGEMAQADFDMAMTATRNAAGRPRYEIMRQGDSILHTCQRIRVMGEGGGEGEV